MYFIAPLFWLFSISFVVYLMTRKSNLNNYHKLSIIGICFVFQFIFLLYIARGWNDPIYEKYGYNSKEANWFDAFLAFGTPLIWAFIVSTIFKVFGRLIKKN
jgi:hypothetical protein